MDMPFASQASDKDYLTCKCALSHSRCLMLGPENMASQIRQMFHLESSKMQHSPLAMTDSLDNRDCKTEIPENLPSG